jgi:hypothetical protein
LLRSEEINKTALVAEVDPSSTEAIIPYSSRPVAVAENAITPFRPLFTPVLPVRQEQMEATLPTVISEVLMVREARQVCG